MLANSLIQDRPQLSAASVEWSRLEVQAEAAREGRGQFSQQVKKGACLFFVARVRAIVKKLATESMVLFVGLTIAAIRGLLRIVNGVTTPRQALAALRASRALAD